LTQTTTFGNSHYILGLFQTPLSGHHASVKGQAKRELQGEEGEKERVQGHQGTGNDCCPAHTWSGLPVGGGVRLPEFKAKGRRARHLKTTNKTKNQQQKNQTITHYAMLYHYAQRTTHITSQQ